MENNYLTANTTHPNMGLNNSPCLNPTYWCPLHKIWLSEEDANRKGCFRKMTADMMEVRRCPNLQKKDYEEYLKKLQKP